MVMQLCIDYGLVLLSPIDLIFDVSFSNDVFNNFQAADLGTTVQYSPPAGIDAAWNATQVCELHRNMSHLRPIFDILRIIKINYQETQEKLNDSGEDN